MLLSCQVCTTMKIGTCLTMNRAPFDVKRYLLGSGQHISQVGKLGGILPRCDVTSSSDRYHMQGYISKLLSITIFISLSFTGAFAKGYDVKTSFMQLPLSFIKNEGQKDPSILYYEQGMGHVTTFTKKGIS